MNSRVRTSYPSARQVEALVSFLELNPDLAKGFAHIGKSVKVNMQKKWKQLIISLNAMEEGRTKSWKQWWKYWSDKKANIKKKAAARDAARKSMDSLDSFGVEEYELSTVEERILTIMSGEEFARGDRQLEINPPETNHIADLKKFPMDVPIVISPMILDMESKPPPSSPPSDVIPEPPSGISYSSVPQPLQETDRHPFPGDNAHKTQIPKRRKRALKDTLQKSNQYRVSTLTGLSERFLQLEERRLELDRTNSRIIHQIIEHSQERDKVVTEVLNSIGDALERLADNITENNSNR